MKKVVKILSVVLVMALILTSGVTVAFADSWKKSGESFCMKEIEKLKKEYKKNKIPVVIKYGKFLIPTRPLEKALGVDLEWDEEEKILTIEKGKTTIVINLESGDIKVNGNKVDLGKYGWTNNKGRFVPISLISKILRDRLGIDEDDKDEDEDEKEDEDEDEDEDEYKTEKITIINDNVTGTGKGQFEYVGDWKYGEQSGAYNGDNHWSNTENNYFLFRFTGNQIRLYGAKADTHGIAAVSIDGGSEVLIDYYAAERTDNALLYISPELQDGDHVLKVRVTGAKNSNAKDYYVTVDRIEIVELVKRQGALEGVVNNAPASVNLSLQGKIDWVHWGFNGVSAVNRKVTNKATPDISNYTKIGNGTLSWVSSNPVKYSWTDGAPTPTVINTTSAIYMSNVGSGFQFTVPADTKEKVLKIYVAAWDATGTIEAVLSDGSAAPYTVDIVSDSGITCKVVTIRYKAESVGEKLTIKYTVKSTKGSNINNISLQAATLS
ncbi:MAG: copper amine oxidase N-terminal domain-containing protein [Firmicutes bacterium]|nr:copper amine oxidase N-terminal domain-containing protein [Bacillota bacterium]